MQTENRIFDDLARLATSALGAAQGMRGEAEAWVKAQAERWIADMNLVTREEFDAVRAMAAAAREENEKLAARLAELEAKLGK